MPNELWVFLHTVCFQIKTAKGKTGGSHLQLQKWLSTLNLPLCHLFIVHSTHEHTLAPSFSLFLRFRFLHPVFLPLPLFLITLGTHLLLNQWILHWPCYLLVYSGFAFITSLSLPSYTNYVPFYLGGISHLISLAISRCSSESVLSRQRH